MKQTFFIMLVVALTAFSSCRKHTDTSPSNGGSWTIKGTTYYADSCTAPTSVPGAYDILAGLTPVNSNTISTYSQLVITFGLPPVGNTSYNLVSDTTYSNSLDSNQAYLYVNIGGLTNPSMYQSITSGAVAVTLSPTGKISASATNILVQNSGPPYDTTRLTFNISQTN